jgi:hypothetical protein
MVDPVSNWGNHSNNLYWTNTYSLYQTLRLTVCCRPTAEEATAVYADCCTGIDYRSRLDDIVGIDADEQAQRRADDRSYRHTECCIR